MKVGVLANPKLAGAKDIASELLKVLGNKVDVVIEKELAKLLGMKGQLIDKMKVDVLITIGGDGTILYAMQRCDAPVAGINAGRLGFLTEIRKDQIRERVKRIVSGDYTVEERLKLKVEINKKRLPDCVNEAVLHTAHVSKMRHFEVMVDGRPALSVRADGLIISTPTGSTSYAMSVGGPIIDPRVSGFAVAPIAPFNLGVRPLVIPSSSQIKIRILNQRNCVLVLDGQQEIDVMPKCIVSIARSEKPGRFVRFEEDFYAKAWEKLRM